MSTGLHHLTPLPMAHIYLGPSDLWVLRFTGRLRLEHACNLSPPNIRKRHRGVGGVLGDERRVSFGVIARPGIPQSMFMNPPSLAYRLKISTMPLAKVSPMASIPPRSCVHVAVALQYPCVMLSTWRPPPTLATTFLVSFLSWMYTRLMSAKLAV